MDPIELSQQLKKPTGETGREVAEALNKSNQRLYDLTFEALNLEPNQHVLEIGFGNGSHFPRYFEIEPSLHVTGVDFSDDMCKEAKARNSYLIEDGKLNIHCSETSSLPFNDNLFDLIIAINVIYFLDPPEHHLQEIRRVLKPGGIFLIGYRPRHSIEHFEFTKQNFILYETDELVKLMELSGYNYFMDETKSYRVNASDGKEFKVTDSILLVQK